MQILVRGWRSSGDAYEATVHLPQGFAYLMMKLHAFDDRKDDPTKDAGRHHALDLCTVVGLLTEEEYEQAKALGQQHANDEHVANARRIISTCFAHETQVGMLRLGEHPLHHARFRLADFMAVLAEIFSTADPERAG
jgi:predicted nucleotidyltransferase